MSGELVSVSMNSAESSASFLNPVMKNATIGPQSYEIFEHSATDVSPNNIKFNLPISDSNLLSRRLLLEMPLTFTVPKQGDAESMTRHFPLCLRADALNKIITSCTIRVNGYPINGQPYLVSSTVQRYDRDDDHLHHSQLSTSPNTPDIVFASDLGSLYDPTAGAYTPVNPDTLGLKEYHFRTANASDPSFPSRSVMKSERVGETNADGDAAGENVHVTYTCRYALKNPLLSSNSGEFLANIKSFEVDLVVDSSSILQRAFFAGLIRAKKAQALVANMIASHGRPNGLDFTRNKTDYKLIGYVVNPSNPDQIPTTQIVPINEWYFSEDSIGAINAGVTTDFIHPPIESQHVPSHIFISAVPAPASESLRMTDYHALISDLRLIINNQTYTLSNWKSTDFYNMCVDNGLMIPWNSFDVEPIKPLAETTASATAKQLLGCGAPLCFRPSKNFGRSLVENLTGQSFKLELRYKVKNTSNVNMSFVSRVAFVKGATLELTKGSQPSLRPGISQEELAEALSSGKILPTGLGDQEISEGLLGGSIASWLSSHRSDINASVSSIMPMLQLAAMRNPQLFPAVMGATALQAFTQNRGGSELGGARLAGSALGGSNQSHLRNLGLAL